MAVPELTSSAKADLAAIVQYTLDTWGHDQAKTYVHKFKVCLEKINKGTALSRLKLKDKKCKALLCEHHYIFYLDRDPKVVIAILHERMDLMKRLKERLE